MASDKLTSGKVSFSAAGVDCAILWFLLLYAYADGQAIRASVRLLDHKEFAESGDGLFDPVASCLVKALDRQRGAGFLCNYVEKRDIGTVPRGRIDIRGTLAERARLSSQICYAADEYVENTVENQIIKVTLIQLINMRHGDGSLLGYAALPTVSDFNKKKLCARLPLLSHVSEIDPRKINWSSTMLKCRSGEYELMMRMCRIVLDKGNKGLRELLESPEKTGETFEAAIRGFFSSRYPDLRPDVGRWNVGFERWSDGEREGLPLPGLRTDMILCGEHRSVVIEAKFHRYPFTKSNLKGERKLDRHCCNQLFSYVSHVGYDNRLGRNSGREAYGILLYGGMSGREWGISWNECGYGLHARSLPVASGGGSSASVENLANALVQIAGFARGDLENLPDEMSGLASAKDNGAFMRR